MDVALHILILFKHIFIATCALSSVYLLTLNVGTRLDKRYEATKKIVSYVMVPMPIYYSIKFYWFGTIDEIPYLFSLNTLLAGSIAFSILSTLTEHFFKIEELRIGRLYRTFLSSLLFLVAYLAALLIEEDVQSYTWRDLWITRNNLPQCVRVIHSFILISSIIYYGRSFFWKRDAFLQELSESELQRGVELTRWATRTYSIVLIVFAIMIITLFTANVYLFSLFVLSVGVSYLTQTIRCFNFFTRWSMRSSDQEVSVESDSLIKSDRLSQLIVESMSKNRYYTIAGISADEVAQKIGIPRHKLNAYLKIVLNINFNQWIQQLRIQEAKSILETRPNLSISDLAHQLGYRDTAMFSRNFKLIAGLLLVNTVKDRKRRDALNVKPIPAYYVGECIERND